MIAIETETVLRLVKQDNDTGMCINCGYITEAWSVEADAENYLCDSCGEEQVFGTAELLFMIV